MTHSAAGRKVEFILHSSRLPVFSILKFFLLSYFFLLCFFFFKICNLSFNNSNASPDLFSVYVSCLCRQVSSFFDALSCRQESRVYITFRQITCFFYTQVFFFFPIFFFSVFSFLKFVTLASTTQIHHPIYFLCTCHACAGRHPVF